MRAYHFLVTVTMAWSCSFCSIGLGQEGALPVTTDLHAHGLNQQQLDSLADIMQQAVDQAWKGYWAKDGPKSWGGKDYWSAKGVGPGAALDPLVSTAARQAYTSFNELSKQRPIVHFFTDARREGDSCVPVQLGGCERRNVDRSCCFQDGRIETFNPDVSYQRVPAGAAELGFGRRDLLAKLGEHLADI